MLLSIIGYTLVTLLFAVVLGGIAGMLWGAHVGKAERDREQALKEHIRRVAQLEAELRTWEEWDMEAYIAKKEAEKNAALRWYGYSAQEVANAFQRVVFHSETVEK